MVPALVTVHGFNVYDPNNSTGKLAAALRKRGYDVFEFHYGHATLLDVRIANGNIAAALGSYLDLVATLTKKEVIPIGHSNGCALIKLAGDRGTYKRCVYISPALNCSSELAPAVERCDVLHNDGDRTVSVSSILPFHMWGAMGRYGYKGSDTRYINHDCSRIVDGHSDWFSHVDWLQDKIHETVAHEALVTPSVLSSSTSA